MEVHSVLHSVRMMRELARACATIEDLDLRVCGGVRNELVCAVELAAADTTREASRDACRHRCIQRAKAQLTLVAARNCNEKSLSERGNINKGGIGYIRCLPRQYSCR